MRRVFLPLVMLTMLGMGRLARAEIFTIMEQAQQQQDLQDDEKELEQLREAQALLQEQQIQQQQQLQAHLESHPLLNGSKLPKLLAKKSIADEEAIQAAEAYEFQYLPSEAPPEQAASQIIEIEPLALASQSFPNDPASESSEHVAESNEYYPKVGYSVGGPLVNIARGAAQQAHTFEKNQPAAAAQAAYVAKNRLGQSAGLSAATAAAAFAGKQIIYRGLQQQAYNAKRALESEKLQLQQAQRAATAAANSAQQAMHQVQVITTALNAAQATSQHASAAAAEAAAELAAQTAMVGAAKARVQAIEDQLFHARIDYEAAKSANMKAAQAAQDAQNNAAAAAAHAAEVANANHHHHHHDDHHHHHHHHHHQEHHHQEHHHHDHDHLAKPSSEYTLPDYSLPGFERRGHKHRKHHLHLNHLESANKSDDDADHDRRESVAIPIAKQGSESTQLSPVDGELLETTTQLPGDARGDIDRNNREFHTVPSADRSGILATVASISEDEYDSDDSFPY